ncbi:hypothetical protein DL766_005687 [Monosporascus sp. MC13-8B]|nr:hypothetical protein DL763_001321 [Monosporascus cannonballus]RYP28773.1 hypothetical protein DL766_005687 [Monosporascus sp. MC13-8B]
MSSRQLRKLQKQRELATLETRNPAAGAESEEESEDDQPVLRPKANAFARFAALGGMDDVQEDDEEDDNDEGGPAEPAKTPTRGEPERTETPRSASSKKSKKKKKKSKRVEPAAAAKEPPAPKNEIDEIDRAIQELNLAKKQTGSSGAEADVTALKAYERICELLRINTHHLKVINEMRHLFGRDAITAAQNEEEEEQARNRRNRQQLQNQVGLETYLKGQPGQALPEVTLRRNPFLPGKDTWPRASTEGLTMQKIEDGSEAGTVEFTFAHDKGYNALERQFFALVQMYDPMQLVHFLHRHPYHISSLIQVSKVAKQDQNSALSADLCERALFTFGRVSLSAFRQKLEEGKARLAFRRPENRQFWLAGYHYLKSLVMKGTYRTALEWSKLLLSMDLTDPYGIIHFIHPLAIRAHESKWFVDFCDSEALDECDTAQDYIRQTLVLARLQQKDTAGAKALLIEGMERIPWLYSSLFRALNLDIPKAIWGMQPRNQHENLFVELYIHQAKSLWDNAQATSLLKEVAARARKPDWSSFATTPLAGRNAARFVYLDNTPALMGLVPGGMLSESPNWEFDPLPPPLEDNIFSHDSQKLPWNPPDPDRDGYGDSGREHIELRVPRDPQQLRRFLDRIRREGAPRDVQRVIEQAIGQAVAPAAAGEMDPSADDDGDDEDGDEGDDHEFVLRGEPANLGPGGIGRLFQAFMGMIGAGPPGAALPDDGDGDSDIDFTAMPGRFVDDGEDTDDEMPPLMPADVQRRGGAPRDDDGDNDPNDIPGSMPGGR